MTSLQRDNKVSQERNSPRLSRHLMLLIMAAAVTMGAIAATHEWIVVEKVITALLMPVGIVWSGVFLVIYFSAIFGNRYLFLFSLAVWTLLGLASNEMVADWLTYSLEKPYVSIDPLNCDHYEYVVVLGGGVSYPITQREQFGTSGDRIAVAAQMYHAKKVDKIIVTGSQIESLNPEGIPSYGEMSRALLERLNVPSSAIETSPGRNTREELANLAKRFADRKAGTRIGLITSAWHLPRATRLAQANGLEIEPIPADFRTEQFKITLLHFLPSADYLHQNSDVLHEYLARFAGQ